MNETQPKKSANEQLTDLVHKELVDKGLLPERIRASAKEKIRAGTASSTDWATWAGAVLDARKQSQAQTATDSEAADAK